MLAKVQQLHLQDKGSLVGDVTSNCGMGGDVQTDRSCLPRGRGSTVFEQTPGIQPSFKNKDMVGHCIERTPLNVRTRTEGWKTNSPLSCPDTLKHA